MRDIKFSVLPASELVEGDEVVMRLNTDHKDVVFAVRALIDDFHKTNRINLTLVRAARLGKDFLGFDDRQPSWGQGYAYCDDGKWWKAAIIVVNEARRKEANERRDATIVQAYERFQRGEATTITVNGKGITLAEAQEAWQRTAKRLASLKESQKVYGPIDDPDFV